MIRSYRECEAYVQKAGVVPFMRDARLPSLETLAPGHWWTGDSEDPWGWRKQFAMDERFVYAKFLGGKASIASREAFALLARVRRGGMDFEEHYSLGTTPRRQKRIMEVLCQMGPTPSHRLKKLAGFGKEGEKGFEGALAALQVRTDIIICGFERKRDRFGMEYGWDSTVYAPYVPAGDGDAQTARAQLLAQLKSAYPDIAEQALESVIDG